MNKPTLRKMLTKLKEMVEMKKAQHLTKAIRCCDVFDNDGQQ